IAKDVSDTTSDRLRVFAGAVLRQMQRYLANLHASVVANAKVFRKPEHFFVMLQRSVNIGDLKNRGSNLRVHFLANDQDQRPGANGCQLSTGASSPGSLHPMVSQPSHSELTKSFAVKPSGISPRSKLA